MINLQNIHSYFTNNKSQDIINQERMGRRGDVMITHCGTQEFETKQLILRRFEYEDVEDMKKYWISDPKIQFMYSEPIYESREEILELLKGYIESYNRLDYYRWAIILKDTNECIGQIAYFLVDTKNHYAEIEYCIGSKFQRKGLATEATKGIINYGFDKIHLHKVQICHKASNHASKGVIEKCGFTYEGTLRDYFYIEGSYIDRLYYSILKEEW